METIISIASSFFPARKGKMKFSSFVPLIAFIAVYAGLIIYLLSADKVIFSKPAMFWMLLTLPWFWWMGVNGWSGIGGFRNGTSIFVRLMLGGTFIALMADPRTVQPNSTLSVMYAVDLSDSIGQEMRDNSLQFMASTVEKRLGDMEAGLLVFGREAAVELPPRKSFPFERLTALTNTPKDGTDIEKALSLAAAMIPESNNGRIVLISDGTCTAGNLDKVLDELKIRQIPVDVLPVQFEYKDEVWLEKLQLPVNVRIGETYEASVILSSLQNGRGKLALYENDELLHEENITFRAGKNRYSMPLHLRNAGYYEYRAVITVPEGKDGWKENNIAVNSLYLQGKGKVLMVTHPNGDPKDWTILSEAIKTSKREVKIIDAFDVPRDSLSLLPYDCIIFVNVPAHELDPVQMQACHDAVYNQGSGFMMVGGPDSFGPGGYHNTSIEQLLPVDMDISNRKVMPKGALAVILHTCEFEDGNSWAKKIAKASIKVLSEQDEAGLLAWDLNGDSWIFPLTSVTKYESVMVPKINNCNPADMPSFIGTMEMALAGLSSSDAAQKHVIIISDGDPQPPSATLLNKFRSAKISITTVLVDGFHQGQFITPMKLIANSTGGRFYHPKNPNQLPSIFIKEAQTLKKSLIQEKKFVPTVEFNDGSLLKGIDAIPSLYGYILCSAKPDPRRCRVILRGPDKEQIDPVLAIGNYGVGKSAAFTSDLSPRWGRDWLNWDKAVPFIKQAIVSISRVAQEGSLRISTDHSSSEGTVIVEDFHPQEEFLEINARVAGPNGRIFDVELKQVAPRRYQGKFPIWGKGTYQIIAAAKGSSRSEKVVGGLVLPYSTEYLKFSSNMKDLQKIVDKTGGKFLKGSSKGEEIFIKPTEIRLSSQPFFDTLLLILACLIPLDVAIRRVQIDWIMIKEMLGREKAQTSTQTMGALLDRKKSIRTAEEEKKPEKPVYTPPVAERKPGSVLKAAKAPETKSDKKADSAMPEEGGSTTSRLLAMKKKRDQNNK